MHLTSVEQTMDSSRAAKLADLKFQIRSLQQQELSLIYLSTRHCEGIKPAAEKKLLQTRLNIKEAEDALTRFLAET